MLQDENRYLQLAQFMPVLLLPVGAGAVPPDLDLEGEQKWELTLNDLITKKKGKNGTLMVENHGLLRCCWSLEGGSSCCSWRKSHRAERRDLMVKAPTLWLHFHLRRRRIARPPLPAAGECSSTSETFASGGRRERVARRFLGGRCVPARTS